MSTWALIIMIFLDRQPIGITSVPGYPSNQQCLEASVTLQQEDSVLNEQTVGYKHFLRFHCIEVPKK
jgi:hypothetical protein